MRRILDRLTRHSAFRAAILVLTFLLLIFIFSSNPVRLKNDLKLGPRPKVEAPPPAAAQGQPSPESVTAANQRPTSPAALQEPATFELIKTEHQKAIDEIKMLSEKIDTWFHYKFILVGGVIALFLGHFGILGRQINSSPRASERTIESAFMSNRTGAMLALVCVVAFTIDMHIRTNLTGMQQLGQWIFNYVEPAYFNNVGAATGSIPKEALVASGFIPWETFLRSDVRQSMHNNPFYKASFSTQLHFMTMIVYVFYTLVFQNICLLSQKGRRQQLALLGFIFVHVSALAFIIVAHTVPDAFLVKCFPISGEDCWLTGSDGSRYYLFAWLLLILFNVPYLLRLLLNPTPPRSPSATEASADDAAAVGAPPT